MNPSNPSPCDCSEKKSHPSILYTLLSSGSTTTSTTTSSNSEDRGSDEQQDGGKDVGTNQEAIYPWECGAGVHYSAPTLPTIIKLKYAEEVCPYAAQLLLKTVDFITNLPSVLCLSRSDRAKLFTHCWSELLILTMAQYRFHLQVEKVSLHRDSHDNESTNTSSDNVNSKPVTPVAKSCPERDSREGALLKYIIATQGIPTTSDIDTLNAFFQKCQTLQIDDKEFAYLKTTIFFNPGKTLFTLIRSNTLVT